MKRSEKIKQAALIAQQSEDSDRDPAGREAARREWGETRKSARELFLDRGDWMGPLNIFRGGEGYYSSAERERMCKDFTEELITRTLGREPAAAAKGD